MILNLKQILGNNRKENYYFICRSIFLFALFFAPVTMAGSTAISDSDISDQVENRILSDISTPSDIINVQTDNGIVTLTGTVSNILAKERVARITETIRGTRSVINLIRVKPTFNRSASWLKLNIKNALFYDTAIESDEINVAADNKGRVVLSGIVDSWAKRDLAETVTKGVSGVTEVDNGIIVNSGYTERFDKEIKAEIEGKLYWDTLVDSAMISVEVDEGKVTLSGIVGSAAEKRRSRQLSRVIGVSAINNSKLDVKKWARDKALRKHKYVPRDDFEIQNVLQKTLLSDPRINSSNIKIKVRNGYVTLQGVVDNIRAEKAAISNAKNTIGVLGVNSIIKIRPVEKIEDKKIAEKVRDALLRNPVTEGYNIDVHVRNQIAYLRGTVDSYFEKGTAENIVFKTKGIVAVRNKLTVSYPETTTYNPYVHDWSIYDFPWYSGSLGFTKKSDREIRNNIEHEFLWNPYVDSEDVTVTVDNGIVTLTGTVDSIRENEAAEENALKGGAKGVINKLNIRLINDRLTIG